MHKIREVSIPSNGRVIVISDIHGELELFESLLEKVNFSLEDYLIINGDLCEKGANSKGVVRSIMDLSASHPHVYVTEGNCDTLVEDLLDENPKLMNYLHTRKHTIISEWLVEVGFEMKEGTTVQEIKEILTAHFSTEINWLMELPTAIETEDYVFVHAGLDDRENWRETDRITAITMPAFLDRSHQTGKYVVVGHWPVVNYSTRIPTYNPIIDHAKKIIAIDGGNVIKSTGQLNAFIIQRTPSGDTFNNTYTDKHPVYEVLMDFKSEPMMTGVISYPYFDINPLQSDEHFTLCEQPETNEQLYVKNEYIQQYENGQFHVKTGVSCAQISVNKGDVVSVVDSNCEGFDLIKKDGVEGWIEKGILLQVNENKLKEKAIKVLS
ncbi:serine/threonine protein phosphatase [Bacillus sp. BHET2]|uniref:metallophosphoesterase n=1 Tax=Bacillus sp. BHET2 TaxID=2583818 RepID=UPI00110D5B3E|nr:metallophosphoesterase [Bacillus sp. BHET2]TMU85041.1 serine/threonine protein phosphatase [Bacillus sp. BHET2]